MNFKMLTVFFVSILLTGILVMPFGKAHAATDWDTVGTYLKAQKYKPTVDQVMAFVAKYPSDQYTVKFMQKTETSGGVSYNVIFTLAWPKGKQPIFTQYSATSIRMSNKDASGVFPVYMLQWNGVDESAFTTDRSDSGFTDGPLSNIAWVDVPQLNTVPDARIYEVLPKSVDEIYAISRTQLNQELGKSSFFVVRPEGVKGVQAVIGDDSTTVLWEHEFTDAEVNEGAIYDISDELRKNKSLLSVGRHNLYLYAYDANRWTMDEEVDPNLVVKFQLNVYQTDDDLPSSGGGNGGGTTDPSDDSNYPQRPDAPDSAWDVIGWLGYIADWIIYVVDGVGYFVGKLGTSIGSIFTAAGGVTAALASVFGWLPPEVLALITLAITVGVVARLFKR